jgi:predicted dehydrogenase
MKVGIIGCGDISKVHVRNIRRIKGLDIVGVCDINPEKARKIAHEYNIENIYLEVSKLLEAEKPDVVHVLTPPQSHMQLSIQAMEAGCHVLVEKPMALNERDAERMVRTSERNGVKLGVCHNNLFSPSVIEAREMVANGSMGDIVGVDVVRSIFHGWKSLHRKLWLYDLPGSLFHEFIPHGVYLQMEFLKSLRVRNAISKKTGSTLPTPFDELRVLLSISLSATPYLNYLNIYGTKMTIQVDLITDTLIKLKKNAPGENVQKALINIGESLLRLSKTVTNAIKIFRDPTMTGHMILIKEFYDSIRRGQTPPVTGEDGRANAAVLDQIWEALDRDGAN